MWKVKKTSKGSAMRNKQNQIKQKKPGKEKDYACPFLSREHEYLHYQRGIILVIGALFNFNPARVHHSATGR